MAEKFPYDIAQNPAPNPESGQAFETSRQALVNAIMQTFLKVLPSNYVAFANGPWYTLQFQAMAEQLAAFQITAQEVYKDSDWDFTRPDFLFAVLGTLVFPEATAQNGLPLIDGDTNYREFLQKMVLLLLRGSTAQVMEEGVELLLKDASATLVEKFLHSVQRDPIGLWTIDNQFEVEINIEGNGGTTFPTNPFLLLSNEGLVLQALKPAHVLYGFRFLFRDAFGDIFNDSGDGALSWVLEEYRYDDLRKNCYGTQSIVGTAGITPTDRTLFTDTTLSLASVLVGATLRIDTGPNASTYRVTDVRVFPFGDDATPRTYSTTPSGLTGTLTVLGEAVYDLSQNFASAVEGEVLTIATGPNTGKYRLDTLLGSEGGPVGFAPGPATAVRMSRCLLRVERRMAQAATGQNYVVDVDRLGVRAPKDITDEDVSEQFYL